MEETFFKRVSVKEELPTDSEFVMTIQEGWAHPVVSRYFADFKTWQNNDKVIAWLKPLPILSRDELIREINKATNEFWNLPFTAREGLKINECIADAILKSGLPEKKVEIKRGKYGNDFVICPSCKDEEHLIGMDNNFCPNCGSKILWK